MVVAVVPERDECIRLMESTGMLENIKRHSLVVSRVAVYVGKLLKFYGHPLDLQLIEAGSLLHDIAKTQCLETGEDHARRGARYVEEHGYPELKAIVGNHVRLLEEELKEPVDEVKLVNYADKRVLHERIVTLEERFEDLRKRYGTTEDRVLRICVMGRRMKILERNIFKSLPVSPEHVLYLNNHR